MAKQLVVENKPGVIQRMRTFFEEVRNEMKKVTWPTREDLMVSTKVTLYLLLIMAVIIFVYDKIFAVVVLFLLNIAS